MENILSRLSFSCTTGAYVTYPHLINYNLQDLKRLYYWKYLKVVFRNTLKLVFSAMNGTRDY